jgi:Tol biopolymer transport system component
MWRLGRAALATAVLVPVATVALWAGSALAAFPLATNGSITYDAYDGSQFDVFTMGPTGANQLDLTNTSGYDVSPSFSPDGRRIVFVRQVDLVNDVFVMNADGSGQVDLTNTPGFSETTPVFSPDGRTIVYSSDDEAAPPVDLHVMQADGSGQRPLTNTPTATEKLPDFSPDGRRIVFQGCEAANCEIETIAPDGSSLTDLSNTPAPISEGDPAFSPDGQRIVFVRSSAPGSVEIALMNADGSGERSLIAAQPQASPMFSPDERLIAYNEILPASSQEIFTINVDGTTPVDLTNTPSLREEAPAWQSIFTCGGRRATIVGSDAGEKLKGTKRADVIVGNGGNDRIKGLGGNDRLCGGAGRDRIAGGKGRKDLCRGQQGKDFGGKGCERGKL